MIELGAGETALKGALGAASEAKREARWTERPERDKEGGINLLS